MNPILIRHLYGSVRRNRFFWLLAFYLLGIGLLALFFALIAAVPLFTDATTISMLNLFTGGRTLYWYSGVILILTASLVVPITALGALAGERENRTLDILKVTTLKARSIVLGKLASALLTGSIYVFAPLPLLMTGFWLGGVTTIELLITLIFLILTMVVSIAWALFLSALVRKTIAAVLVFYGLTLAIAPVIAILASVIVGLSEAWQQAATVSVQPFLVEAMIQYGWVILAGLHPLSAAVATEALGFEQNSWFFLQFDVSRYRAGPSAPTFLGTITLPSPWLTYTIFTISATAILLWLTTWRLNRPER